MSGTQKKGCYFLFFGRRPTANEATSVLKIKQVLQRRCPLVSRPLINLNRNLNCTSTEQKINGPMESCWLVPNYSNLEYS